MLRTLETTGVDIGEYSNYIVMRPRAMSGSSLLTNKADDPDEAVFSYNERGQIVSVIASGESQITGIQYDNQGRLIAYQTIDHNEQFSSQFSYSEDGTVHEHRSYVRSSYTGLNEEDRIYSAEGNLLSSNYGRNVYSNISVDSNGFIVGYTLSFTDNDRTQTHTPSIRYDSAGNVISILNRGALVPEIDFTYDEYFCPSLEPDMGIFWTNFRLLRLDTNERF